MKKKEGKEATIMGGNRKGQKESRKATKLTKNKKISEKSSILMRNISSFQHINYCKAFSIIF